MEFAVIVYFQSLNAVKFAPRFQLTFTEYTGAQLCTATLARAETEVVV